MTSSVLSRLSFAIILFLVACDDKETISEDTTSYTWKASSISPDNALTVYRFKKGEDGGLYILGWPEKDKTIFAKRVGNQWKNLAEVNETVIGDFAVFQDTVYFSTATAVKRSKGAFVDVLLNTYTHCTLEVYHNKLFIAGSSLPYDGKEEYSVLSYSASKEFSPVFKEWPGGRMTIANDKLFIGGPENAPLLIYDDGFLEETTYRKDFLNIDNDESIYSLDNGGFIAKFSGGETEKIGNAIIAEVEKTRLQFYGSALVISGQDHDDTSNSLFLTANNTWKSIDTGFIIYDLINFDNRILAGSDGQIMELSTQ